MVAVGVIILLVGLGGFFLLLTGAGGSYLPQLASVPMGLGGWAIIAGIGVLIILLNRRPGD